jgi:hypothetical protein
MAKVRPNALAERSLTTSPRDFARGGVAHHAPSTGCEPPNLCFLRWEQVARRLKERHGILNLRSFIARFRLLTLRTLASAD